MESANQNITYADLVNRYGESGAFNLLLTVERLAKTKDEIISIDMNGRLIRALDELNNTDCMGDHK